MNRVLVVAAHSDDEALGCSGTLAKYIDEGFTIDVIFMTNGVSSRDIQSDSSERVTASSKAMSKLGVSSISQFDFPDNAMDKLPLLEIVKKIEEVIELRKPQIVLTHHAGDLNIDHCITHRAVMTACRPTPEHTVKQILTFEVLSSTEWNSYQVQPFIPNFYVDITNYADKKVEIVECYEEEMREPPHSRSVEHIKILMKHRGFSVGVEAAEAFMLVRYIK
ncbi:PIG-L deacetylase family protein [Psychrobacter immobilis]|uniref:PIG-L deacetylase family protein n=1 Tax=Psychrobacter immobilis TaxID=498 RepID=UPI001918916E|nr:PIG-L deacetylase family protein [Psychrobacter immobilis]